MRATLSVHPEVAAALAAGAPVVALESTIISHGLPRPDNLDVARRVEQAVRAGGAVPATVAVLDGTVHVGLDAGQLEAVAGRDDIVKVSVRDLGDARGARGRTVPRPSRRPATSHTWPASVSSPPAAWAGCTAARGTPGTSPPTSRHWAVPRWPWCAPG